MPSWHALNKTDHLHAGYQKYANYFHAQNDTIAPLLIAELGQALPYYPLAFVQLGDNSFQLVTLHSLQPGLNLFVNAQGQWLAPYVPSHYRSYPFKLIANAQKNNELTLCFDEQAGLVHTQALADDVKLFTDEGELSGPMRAIVEFLQQCEQNRQVTQQRVDQLSANALIEPWSIEVKQSADNEAPNQRIEGLYKINETALQSLAPEVLSELAKSGALALAYAQLFSQARLKDFHARYQYHHNQQQHAEQKQQALNVDLDKLFGEDDDSLKF